MSNAKAYKDYFTRRGSCFLYYFVRHFIKSFIFTDIQRVKTELFYKSNSVKVIDGSFMVPWNTVLCCDKAI